MWAALSAGALAVHTISRWLISMLGSITTIIAALVGRFLFESGYGLSGPLIKLKIASIGL
jgi:hypothetical protein